MPQPPNVGDVHGYAGPQCRVPAVHFGEAVRVRAHWAQAARSRLRESHLFTNNPWGDAFVAATTGFLSVLERFKVGVSSSALVVAGIFVP